MQTAEQQIEAVVEPVCRAHGVELVQAVRATESGGVVLRVLIDRPGSEAGPGFGVTVADCQAVSRDLGPALEVNEAISGAYRLEVSSPGIDRPLVRPRDYERFKSRRIKVQTNGLHPDGRGGERKKFSGTLIGIDGDMVRIEFEGNELPLPFADIAKANVVYEFDRKG